jgi:hypothetical protein
MQQFALLLLRSQNVCRLVVSPAAGICAAHRPEGLRHVPLAALQPMLKISAGTGSARLPRVAEITQRKRNADTKASRRSPARVSGDGSRQAPGPVRRWDGDDVGLNGLALPARLAYAALN